MFINCFEDFDPIYHFTSFESAVKILASQSLRYGQLKSMNDPNESFRQVYFQCNWNPDDDNYKKLGKAKEEIKLYQQISFSCNTPKRHGFQLQNMWGNYGDKGYGVCLVFNKDLLVKNIHKKYYGKIRYLTDYNPAITILQDKNIIESDYSFKKHVRSLFFNKSIEWKCEQEFRIVQHFSDMSEHYLRLQDCWNDAIKAIIFDRAADVHEEENVFKSSSYKAISKMIPKDCMLLQKGKDLDGNDVLYDIDKETKWGNKNIEFLDV